MDKIDVKIEGLEKLYLKFNKVKADVVVAADSGLKRGGMNIIADAQRNIRNNGSNNTGLLSNSGRVQKVNGGYDVGFFDGDGNGYAKYVEYGRSSGKFPPLKAIREWTKKKLRMSGASLDSTTFLIGRKIAQEGTDPHPFFLSAVEENKKEILELVAEEIDKITGKSNV